MTVYQVLEVRVAKFLESLKQIEKRLHLPSIMVNGLQYSVILCIVLISLWNVPNFLDSFGWRKKKFAQAKFPLLPWKFLGLLRRWWQSSKKPWCRCKMLLNT